MSESVLSRYIGALEDSLAPFGEPAAVHLILAKPDTIASYLMSKHLRPPRSRDSRVNNYTLVSYFGWKCPSDRSAHLRRFLESEDPVVRVGAAIYLSLEDSVYGVDRLRELTSSPGFAGWWANVALARRGDRRSVDNLLGGLGTALDVEYRNETYQQWMQVSALLSNSAKSSSLQPPPAFDGALLEPRDKETRKAIERMRKWWNGVRERITLSDPWLPLFSSQGLD
jgi:hypothetical protein